jgi:hypothetical protein
VALTVKVALNPVKVTFEHAEFTVTVIICPFSINTLSPATGILAPGAPPEVADHVEVKFQLPLATE